ncbi:hypothetical protein CGCFRS4_v013227 [Colletotrichum fructicola]|nr:hypothetical protein CGCFRS4_v013227 [Colletotrichum fructicola]
MLPASPSSTSASTSAAATAAPVSTSSPPSASAASRPTGTCASQVEPDTLLLGDGGKFDLAALEGAHVTDTELVCDSLS